MGSADRQQEQGGSGTCQPRLMDRDSPWPGNCATCYTGFYSHYQGSLAWWTWGRSL